VLHVLLSAKLDITVFLPIALTNLPFVSAASCQEKGFEERKYSGQQDKILRTYHARSTGQPTNMIHKLCTVQYSTVQAAPAKSRRCACPRTTAACLSS
jgi:hypothetical protein